MQKATAIILLAAFGLNVLGFYKSYHLLISKVRPGVKTVHYRRLKGKNRVVVKLDKSHPTMADYGFKKRSNSEYMYQGDHYDVVKQVSTTNGEKIILKHDSDEDVVASFLHHLFGHKASSQHPQKPTQKIQKQNITKYLTRTMGMSKDCPTKIIQTLPILIPAPPFLSVHSPPPRPI